MMNGDEDPEARARFYGDGESNHHWGWGAVILIVLFAPALVLSCIAK